MRYALLTALACALPLLAAAQEPELGKRWRVGAYLDGLVDGPALQLGYRPAPHFEGTLAVAYRSQRTTVGVGRDTTFSFGPPLEVLSFSGGRTEFSVAAGLRLSVRAAGDGLYVHPSIQYVSTDYDEAYLAALAENPSPFNPRPDDAPFTDESRLALGSAAGYRFHFLRVLYADIAAAARVRFGHDEFDAYELSARVGLGVRL